MTHRQKEKSGFDLAMEDLKAGRITEYASIKDLIDASKNKITSIGNAKSICAFLNKRTVEHFLHNLLF